MKKLRRVLLIVFVVSALALALIACGQTRDTKHNHQWSEWSVDTATCTQGGTQIRTCTREGCKAQDGKPATETRTTDALGHNVTSWTLCDADHSKHEGVCSRTGCGVTVAEAHHANAAGTECVDCGTALGGSEQCLHPNASATSETAATCTSAKIEHWTCPDCDWTDDRSVGTALDHDKYIINETAAGCTTNKVEHWACHRCDWTDDKEIADTALDHDKYIANETAAGCTTNKVEHWACHRCDWTDDKEIADTALDHDEYKANETAAGCTTNKVEHWACHRCDWTDDKEIADTALGHDEYKLNETVATCTTNKVEHWACHRCDWTDDKEIADTALGHDEYKLNETVATCTTNKVEHWACHRCDWTDDKEIAESALGHNYTDVAWTLAADGTHERECARGCGDKQTETCNNNDVIIGTAATCEAAGRKNGTKCSVCGGNETLGEVIDALGHAWGEWSVDTATCTAGGMQTRTCTREDCDADGEQPAVDTRTTNALGHDEYKINETAATCTTDKVEHWACHRCEWTDDKEIAESALGHDEYKADETAATCTTDKVEHWACHRCEWTDDKEIAESALGHNYTDVAWTPAAGGTHERECARGCGDKQTGTCDGDGVIIGTAAACETDGRENGTKCSVCGGNQTLGAVINALGHSLSVDSVTAATCTAAKVNHMACGRCDYTEDQTEGNPLGHDFTGDAVVVPDDETYHATECSRCDALDLDNKHAAEWDEYGLTADQTQHYRICKHCDIQSTPADHSVTTYTYASNGEHSGECACGKALTEKCELADGANACSACGRIVGKQNGNGSDVLVPKTASTSSSGKDVTYTSGSVTFVLTENNTTKGGFDNSELRFYANNSLAISVPNGYILTVVLTGNDSSRKAQGNITVNSPASATTAFANNGLTMTITNNDTSVRQIEIKATVQVRLTSITVTYSTLVACYHDDTVECKQSAATCEGTGISQDCYRCESCDLYFTTDACTEILENAVVDALGHNYGEWISEVASTCVATGTKGHFRCDVCDTNFDSKKAVLEDLTIAINLDNHSHLSTVTEQAPTCNDDGWNAHYVCDGCGKKYETTDAAVEYDPAVAALGHDLKYRANGTDKHEQHCTRCDYVEGEAEEHTATTWVAETDGHHQVCTVCGLDFNEGEHSYTDGVCVCGLEATHEHSHTATVTKEPTCTEKGVRTYKCDGCDDSYTEDIDALGHDEYKAGETAATCTANKVEHWACHRCDWTDDKEIAETALGHDFIGNVLPITGDATHHAVKCSRCDAFDVDNKEACDYTEQTVDADGHNTACVCGRISSSTPHDYDAATQTCFCGKINPTYLVVVGSDNVVATFEMGTVTSKTDGTSSATYSETANGYTLNITKISGSMYINAGDGTNSALKLATASVAASLSFTVPDNVVKVVIYVARYNTSKAVQLTINDVNVTSPTSAEYIAVTVDTVSVKTIKLGTDKYCYIDKIEYWAAGQSYVADPDQTPTVTPADCMNAGKVSFYCTTAGCTTLHEVAIPTLEHNYGEWIDEVASTCTETGTKGHFHCDACNHDFDSEENEYALLEDLTIAINPNNHTEGLTHVDAQAPTTCDTADTECAGHVEYWQCACGVMYADASRSTIIDSLEPVYLDHKPDWTTLTDSGHSGNCSVCNATIDEQQHVWNEANTGCTICGYEKPAGKHYITTVIIVDGVQVAGIPAGVTLTWDPADTNGAFDEGEYASFTISLNGYNLVGVVVTDSTGNEAEDWIEVDGEYMGVMDDDYTLTITIETLYTITVNNENGATIAWYDENGETVSALTSATEGAKFKLGVTAKGTITVKVGDETIVADEDGLYAFEVGSADLTIDIAVELNEQSTTYQFGSNNSTASGAISEANLKSKFGSAIKSGDTNVVSSASATYVYSSTGNTDNLKFGSSSKQGSLTITFNSNVKVTKIVITAKMYGSESSAINVNGNNSSALVANAKEFEFVLNGEGSVTINITGKRGYIDSIVIYYE